MAPSLHPASYAYAYDQCTNRSRHTSPNGHGWPCIHKERSEGTPKERSGSGCGFADAPPAVHFAVFRYPQHQLMCPAQRIATHAHTAPRHEHTHMPYSIRRTPHSPRTRYAQQHRLSITYAPRTSNRLFTIIEIPIIINNRQFI